MNSMQELDPNEIHFISGGASQYDVIDIASTLVGMHTFGALTVHTLRIVGYAYHNNIFTLIPVSLAQIAGAYVGYNIGQYIKNDE